jgi:hypothetical protein
MIPSWISALYSMMGLEPIMEKNLPMKTKRLKNSKISFLLIYIHLTHVGFSRDRLYRINVFRDFIKRIPAIITTLSSFEEDPAKLEDFINAVSGYMRLYAHIFNHASCVASKFCFFGAR